NRLLHHGIETLSPCCLTLVEASKLSIQTPISETSTAGMLTPPHAPVVSGFKNRQCTHPCRLEYSESHPVVRPRMHKRIDTQLGLRVCGDCDNRWTVSHGRVQEISRGLHCRKFRIGVDLASLEAELIRPQFLLDPDFVERGPGVSVN